MAVLFSAVLLSSILMVSGHEFGIGRCPYVTSEPSFDTDRFLGRWFVIEQIDTSSECLMLDFERTSDTELKVTKLRQYSILELVGIDTNNQRSDVIKLSEETPARMEIKKRLGSADYIVMDTDYDSYALIFECQNMSPMFHRYSASILSRSDNLGLSVINRLKRRLESSDIDTSDFSKIDQQKCNNRGNGESTPPSTIDEGFRTVGTTPSDTDSSVANQDPNTVSTQSTTNSEASPDVAIRNDNEGREPLDENPIVPPGNPDDIPEEPLETPADNPEEPQGNAADTPEEPQGNSADNPEEPQGNAADTPEEPQRNPADNPEEPQGNPGDNPEEPQGNPGDNPEEPLGNPGGNPEVPNSNPDENAVDGPPIVDEPVNNSPANGEEDVQPADAVINTVVSGL